MKLALYFLFFFKFRTDSVATSHNSMLEALTAELEQLLANVSYTSNVATTTVSGERFLQLGNALNIRL